METKDQQIKDEKKKQEVEAIRMFAMDIGIPYDRRVRTGAIRATDLQRAHYERPWIEEGWKWPGVPEYIDGIVSFSSWHNESTTFINLGEAHDIGRKCTSTDIHAVDFLESLIAAQTRNLGKKVHLFIEQEMVLKASEEQQAKVVKSFQWWRKPRFEATNFPQACTEWQRHMLSTLTACRRRFMFEGANEFHFKGLLQVHRTDSRILSFDGSVYFDTFWGKGSKYVLEIVDKLMVMDILKAKKKWNKLDVLHDPAFCSLFLYYFMRLDLDAITKLLRTDNHIIPCEIIFKEMEFAFAGIKPSVLARVKDLVMLRFNSQFSSDYLTTTITSLSRLNTLQSVADPMVVSSMLTDAVNLFDVLLQCGVLCVDVFMFLKILNLQNDKSNAVFLSISGDIHAENYNYFCENLNWKKGLQTSLGTLYDGCLKIEDLGGGRAELDAELQRLPPAEECQPAAKRARIM